MGLPGGHVLIVVLVILVHDEFGRRILIYDVVLGCFRQVIIKILRGKKILKQFCLWVRFSVFENFIASGVGRSSKCLIGSTFLYSRKRRLHKIANLFTKTHMTYIVGGSSCQ